VIGKTLACLSRVIVTSVHIFQAFDRDASSRMVDTMRCALRRSFRMAEFLGARRALC